MVAKVKYGEEVEAERGYKQRNVVVLIMDTVEGYGQLDDDERGEGGTEGEDRRDSLWHHCKRAFETDAAYSLLGRNYDRS